MEVGLVAAGAYSVSGVRARHVRSNSLHLGPNQAQTMR